MGWFIRGLNGACDPEQDFRSAIRYNKLSYAMEKAYKTLEQFDLIAVAESGVINNTKNSPTEEEYVIADRIIRGYRAAGEDIYLWRNNIKSLAEAEDPEGLMAEIKKAEKERNEEIAAETEDLDRKYNSLSEEKRRLVGEIYEWEQKNWADAFKSEDSPYLSGYNWIKEDYDSVYDRLSYYHGDCC